MNEWNDDDDDKIYDEEEEEINNNNNNNNTTNNNSTAVVIDFLLIDGGVKIIDVDGGRSLVNIFGKHIPRFQSSTPDEDRSSLRKYFFAWHLYHRTRIQTANFLVINTPQDTVGYMKQKPS